MNPSRWRLDGKVALVSGASKGIGYACARELAALGADVLLVARDETALEHAQSELAEEFGEREFFTFAADVAEAEQRLEVFDWIADLDVELSLLINNAGGNLTKPTLDYTADEVRDLIDTNVLSAFEMSRLAHPYLAEHGNAAIVNVASVSGLIHVRSGSPYGMTKAALIQLTRNLACEWAEDGIRVNAVAPWYIRTQRTAGSLADPDYLEEVLQRTPMGRIGEPEEVATPLAVFWMPAAR
jgi:Tropinone reductase 1